MIESIYLILVFLIAVVEIFRPKNYSFDFLTLFSIYFSLLYPVSGFLLAFDYKSAAADIEPGVSNPIQNIQIVFAIVAGYFFVVTGFYSKSAQIIGNNTNLKSKVKDLHVFLYAILLLLISIVSIYIYSSEFGGILQTIASTSARRTQTIDTLGSGKFLFFARLTLVSVFASYLLYSFVFIKQKKKAKIIMCIIFILSVIVAVLAVIITGGRGYFISYFLGFYLLYSLKNKRISWVFIAICACLAYLFLLYGKSFFFSLTALIDGYDAFTEKLLASLDSNKNSSDGFNFYKILSNFSYTIFSLDAAFTKNFQMRWFADFIYGFLSFGIYSMWWPGLVIVCFTYGWIGRYLQTILEKQIHNIFWLPCIYVVVALIWMDFMSSDPPTFVPNYFCYFTPVILLLFIGSKLSITRNSKVEGIRKT